MHEDAKLWLGKNQWNFTDKQLNYVWGEIISCSYGYESKTLLLVTKNYESKTEYLKYKAY